VIAITIPASTNTQIATWVQRNSLGISTKAIVSAMPERVTPALKAVSDAVLAVASELSVDDVLQRLVDCARELAQARFAALGIPDGDGGFRRFLVAGMDDTLIAAMGPLPRTHGMLGAMLAGPGPYRTDDIHGDPRFRGWWPSQHPDMHSFLGVPIVAGEAVIGAFYLTEKLGAAVFDRSDEELIGLLAAHAAIAITNARLYERSRELSILEERNRLALELHDVVSQKLFSLSLGADSAAMLIERDPVAAREQLARVSELARECLAELRTLILGLRPADLQRDGLAGVLGKEVEMLRRIHGIEIALDETEGRTGAGSRRDQRGRAGAGRAGAGRAAGGSRRDEVEAGVLRIALEALHNAVRHAGARQVTVRLSDGATGLAVEVADDGVGFDPHRTQTRSRHLGLTSMEERARELGGRLEIHSAPGSGTTVRLEVAPDGR
jgi:signal transduction histidine kinase